MTTSPIGKPVPRRDLPEKLTGQARYTADIKLPGMLHGKILRSPYPHARVLSVDTAAAARLPGVHALLTPLDAPPGRIAPDAPILDTTVRFVGDEVTAVAAEDEDTAQQAIYLIEVHYDPLPFVTDAQDALRPGAPSVHPEGNLVGGKPLTLLRGDLEEGFARADRVFEETFTTPAHSGAALEPRAAIASWDDDQLTVWKSSRGVHADQLGLALALDIPVEKVRVVGPPLGAGYGNKDETRLAAITAILARRSGRPVKTELTREEEFIAGRHRHATVMDTGAYLSSGPGVVRRAGQAALYLYRCPNVRYDGYLTYTNQPAAGSYRALGAPQGHFALEVMVDQVAEALGLDSLEFRLMNHVGPEGQPGERVTPANQIIDTQPLEGGIPFSSNGLRECLTRGSEAIGWRRLRRPPASDEGPVKRGIGMSMFIYRGGPGGKSTARMRLDRDGAIQLVSGLMDVGEGSETVMAQIAAQELDVPYEDVQTIFADTSSTPEAPITAGSTATFSTGLAAKEAAALLKVRILEIAASTLGVAPVDLEMGGRSVSVVSAPERRMALSEVAQRAGVAPLEVEASVSPGSMDHIVNSFGAHFAEVEVDLETGEVRVLRYVAAHDSGRILNPNLAVNQVEGGVSQMLGFTLSEEMLTDGRNGATLNASYLEHKSPTIMEYPATEVIFADIVDPIGPFGAKALGEPPSIGVAPAVVNAIYNAIGIRIQDLPATPDRIVNAITLQDSR